MTPKVSSPATPPREQTARQGTTPAAQSRQREPAYQSIAEEMTERIAIGTYRPGDQLPTEAELRREFGVSPMTVRRAVGILLSRGLVTTTQGRGTFVRSIGLGEAVFRLQDLTDQWTDDDTVEVRLLEATIVAAEPPAAEILGVPPGSPTIFLRRLLLREGNPLVYQREYVLYDESRPLVEAQLEMTSLAGLFEAAAGAGLLSGRLAIQAVALDSEAAQALHQPEGSPSLRLEQVFHDQTGAPVSWGRFLCRADQFRLTTQLGPESRRDKPRSR